MVYTMKDVARVAGVSPATVSRVLNGTHYIADSTRKRVLAVVDDLRYFKNVHAKGLSTGQSDLLGLVISEITNPFFPEVIRGFQAAASDTGLDVLLLNTEYNQDRVQSVVQKLVESNVRGVAIMTSSIDRRSTAALTEAGIGIVFSDLSPPAKLVSNVVIDYSKGISAAIDHVVALGHRDAAIIAGPDGNRSADHIKQTLVQGLKRRGMVPSLITSSAYRVDGGATAVREILSLARIPSVVFCGSDLIAMGAMNSLEEGGVRVPEDVSVVGIDNLSFAFLTRPPLTTVSVPRELLGVTAFHALQKLLQLKRRTGASYTLDTGLEIRSSTGPARKKVLRLPKISQTPSGRGAKTKG